MKSTHRHLVVLVTTPDRKTARILAREALRAQLIACANLVPQIESHYWWQGRLECSTEILLVMKTVRARLSALEKLILAHHPYDTPEIISLPLTAGNARYLAWWSENVTVRQRRLKGVFPGEFREPHSLRFHKKALETRISEFLDSWVHSSAVQTMRRHAGRLSRFVTV